MKINLKLMAILLFSLPIISFAEETLLLPVAHSGVKVVPLSKIDLPEARKIEILALLKEQKMKGYHEINSIYPNQLLSIHHSVRMELKANYIDPYDTHMKKSISSIPLSFEFKGVPNIRPSNIIGFAAAGSVINKKWTGVAEYFDSDMLGRCSFSIHDMKTSGRSSLISAEAARYDVNNKPNTLIVEGSKSSGFIYEINWYTERFDKKLKCASIHFDPTMDKKLINYAKVIDSLS